MRPFAAFLTTVRYLHLVPQLMRAPDRPFGPRHDPLGGDLLERITATPEKSQVARLRLILEALRAAAPQLMELEANRDKHGRPHLRARYEHRRPRGAWRTEEQLSDGTLRLIGLLWAVFDGNRPLLIEEPEISLHAEVVRLVPRMLARLARRTGRQTMLTTHSLDLLCGEGVGPGEILLLNPREEGVACGRRSISRRPPICWIGALCRPSRRPNPPRTPRCPCSKRGQTPRPARAPAWSPSGATVTTRTSCPASA